MRSIFLFLTLVGASPAPPFTVDGRGYATLDAAVESIRDGEGTILIAPGVYRQCTVQQGGRITYRAVTPGTAIFEREACEEKAAFVLRGRAATIDGIVFRGLRVPDGNGAGIRIEMGTLDVVNSSFRDSQEGILGGGDQVGAIRIERSTFTGLGQCHETEDCAHSIYLGEAGPVTIRRSRFERGQGGHYVKVRAARIEVVDSSFDDTAGSRTNYMIDLPNGATGTIARNMFVQGRAKENYSAFIAVAAEGRVNPSRGLVVEDNDASIAPGVERNTAFVADLSGEALAIGVNRLGPGIRMFEQR